MRLSSGEDLAPKDLVHCSQSIAEQSEIVSAEPGEPREVDQVHSFAGDDDVGRAEISVDVYGGSSGQKIRCSLGRVVTAPDQLPGVRSVPWQDRLSIWLENLSQSNVTSRSIRAPLDVRARLSDKRCLLG
jgi:hypothetical protein